MGNVGNENEVAIDNNLLARTYYHLKILYSDHESGICFDDRQEIREILRRLEKIGGRDYRQQG